jgi:hypothetical protein
MTPNATHKDKTRQMNNELMPPMTPSAEVAVDETELETLAAGLPIHSRLRGGILPCF